MRLEDYAKKNGRKYKGIDSRKYKCSCGEDNCIEAGISFDQDSKGTLLRFHFLQIDYPNENNSQRNIDQVTKAMYIDKATAKELIQELKQIK